MCFEIRFLLMVSLHYHKLLSYGTSFRSENATTKSAGLYVNIMQISTYEDSALTFCYQCSYEVLELANVYVPRTSN